MAKHRIDFPLIKYCGSAVETCALIKFSAFEQPCLLTVDICQHMRKRLKNSFLSRAAIQNCVIVMHIWSESFTSIQCGTFYIVIAMHTCIYDSTLRHRNNSLFMKCFHSCPVRLRLYNKGLL